MALALAAVVSVLFAQAASAASAAPAKPATPAPARGAKQAAVAKGAIKSAPLVPPAQICNSSMLAGPSTPPAGALVVGAGDNSTFNFMIAGVTYWFAPGVHTFGPTIYGQVITADNTTYIGAPGAILDGKNVNLFAFTRPSKNVTVEYLTVRNFGPAGGSMNQGAVNHDSGPGWTVQYNTISGNAGAGVMMGSSDVVRSNCLTGNGQYGFSVYSPGGVTNVTLDSNEISFNDADNWETRMSGCGCSGGGKFWVTVGATVTNNWVHDNKAIGLFADTNNVGFDIEGNYIENNDAEGIVYEISYNAKIANNTFRRNGIVKGLSLAASGNSFPVGAVYISESGGDPRVNNGTYSTFEISGNTLTDNWGGVILWENANRFCNSPVNGSNAACTLGGAATLASCVAGTIGQAPYYSDCRWKTQNLSVHDNTLSVDRSAIGCAATAMCAQEGVLSNYGSYPTWSPYQGPVIQNAITFSQNNHFANNHYVGDWRYLEFDTGVFKTLTDLQTAPYNTELGSTQTGMTPIPPQLQALDADTATLEGSQGHWAAWFSANVSRSAAQAHSGTASLRVDITAPYGWGANLNNDPGFATSAGAKTVSFWGLASTGTGLAATLTVKWRNVAGTDLQTNTIPIASLGAAWSQGTANIYAPAGTAYVSISLSSSTGTNGNTLYFDDFSVAPQPAAAGGALDGDTANLEGSQGHWAAWFSANVSRSTAQAHGGAASLRVDVTAPYGWGANLNNDPGFPTGGGTKTVSFWGLAPTGTGLSANLTVNWRSASGANLQSDVVPIPALGPVWMPGSATLSAPGGTAFVSISVSSSTGISGNTMYFDDFSVADSTGPPPPPPPGGALDPDTASLEGSLGRWSAWFSDSISRSSAQAHSGTSSLRVDVTAPFGWGVNLNHDPGFPTAAGAKTVSFWGLAPTGVGLAVNLTVYWRNSAGANLQVDTVPIAQLSPVWAQGLAHLTAPTGTAFVSLALSSSTGVNGNTLFFDDFSVVSG